MSGETKDELVRVANRRRTSSGSSLSGTYSTATVGSQISEGQTDASNAECARRWEEALKKCKVALKPVDFDIVSRIDSPEKLLAGIEDLRRQTSSSTTGIPAFLAQNALTKSFSELSLVFIASMSPYPVTTGVIWGLLYLAVKLCSDHALASKKLADMVYKIRRQLHLLNRFSRKISDQEEMRVAFVDVFEALILFWAECVNYFRDNPPRTFGTKNWAILEDKFVNATNSVEDAIDHLSKLLDLEPDRQQLRLANLSLKTETASATFPVILLPEPKTEHFVGREDILLDMAAYFWNGDLAKSELSVFCISGIGGVGKTELALAYAKHHHPEYDAILWIGAENQVSLRRGFTKIAIELGLSGAKIEGNPEANLILVHNWLRITDKKWLLIFDNMERFREVKDYLPFDSRGSVIVTTRFAAQADHCRRMQRVISKLTVSESQALFVNLIGWETMGSGVDASEILKTKSREEDEAVTFLLTQMDGLALGIHQMAAVIKFKGLTGRIARFADAYRRRPQKMFQRDGSVGLDGHALGKIWEMSFEAARQESLVAWTLLGVLACLHSDEIHRSMLQIHGKTKGASDFSSSLGVFMDQDDVDDAIDVLVSLALIENTNSEAISIHRLTQSAFLFQESMGNAQLQDIFNSASYLTFQAFPKQVKGRAMHKDWETCQIYSQHALYLAELFAGLKRAKFEVKPSEEFSSLLSNLVWFMYERGDHQDALLIVDIAVDACLDKNGLPYAHLLNSAAVMHFRLNNLTKSREYLDKSREIREKEMDQRDEELAATYANLAAVESGEGNQDTSLELMNRAMDIRKDVAGAEVMMAIGLMTLGRSLALKGEFIQAAQRYRESERVFLETVGQRGFLMIGWMFAWRTIYLTFSTASLHFAKGNLCLFQQNLDEALSHFRQSLDIILTYSKIDLKIAALHYKIGFVQLELGQLKKSMQSFSMALDVARLRQRDGGYAEEARILWKQAQVLERASSPEELAELTETAVMSDPEHLRQEAEAIRRKLRGSGSSLGSPEAGSDQEELLYTHLVNPWDR